MENRNRNPLVAAMLAVGAASAFKQAQPYTPASDGCKSRNSEAKVTKAKRKAKMAAASRRPQAALCNERVQE